MGAYFWTRSFFFWTSYCQEVCVGEMPCPCFPLAGILPVFRHISSLWHRIVCLSELFFLSNQRSGALRLLTMLSCPPALSQQQATACKFWVAIWFFWELYLPCFSLMPNGVQGNPCCQSMHYLSLSIPRSSGSVSLGWATCFDLLPLSEATSWNL